jgi:membrane protein DedA with SNARE-associated domain
MEAWQGELLGYLQHYGLAVLGLILFLESVGAPLPGESLLIAAGALAGEGQFDPWAVGATAVVAAVLGDNLGYAIGRWAGRPFLLRHGGRIGITAERFAKVERLLARHGWIIVAGARFVVLLRQLNGLVAGAAGMSWHRFLLANVAGAIVWVALWVVLAFELGARLHIVTFLSEHLAWAVCIAIVGLLVSALTVWMVGHRKRGQGEEA